MTAPDSSPSPLLPSPRKWWLAAAPMALLAAAVLGLVWKVNEMRSKAAWRRYLSEAVARGEMLDWKVPSPADIPADQNFAAIPLFSDRATEILSGTPASDPLAFPKSGQPNDDLLTRDPAAYLIECRRALTDAGLLAFSSQTDEPARDILRALAKFEPELQQLREARSRPRCQFPIFWGKKYLEFPHLGVVNSVATLLKLRMVCALAIGDSGAAVEDLRDGLRLYRGSRNDPALISSLVRLALVSQVRAAAQFGVMHRHWTDAELREIGDAFGNVNVLADQADGLETEGGFITEGGVKYRALSAWERIKQTRESAEVGQTIVAVPRLDRLSEAVLSLGDAWCYDTEVAQLSALLRARHWIDREHLRFVPGKTDPLVEMSEWAQAYYAGGVRLAKLGQTMNERAAFLQTQVDHLQVACALESWRSGHGEYPVELRELVPEFIQVLPHDVIGGGPLHYRRRNDGTFVLYSVALNGRDDFGRSDRDPALTGTCAQRDWLWGAPLK